VFAELCHASSAVPRDFINVFRQATIMQRSAGADKMTVANVRSAVAEQQPLLVGPAGLAGLGGWDDSDPLSEPVSVADDSQ
jgi:hypothetical protein